MRIGSLSPLSSFHQNCRGDCFLGDKEKQAKNSLLTMQRMNQLSLKSNFSANEIYTRFVTSRFTVIMHHTCHDVFVIKNTTHPDSSQYLSKFVGKNTNFRNDAGQSLERKEGKKVSLFLRVEERLVETRARKG